MQLKGRLYRFLHNGKECVGLAGDNLISHNNIIPRNTLDSNVDSNTLHSALNVANPALDSMLRPAPKAMLESKPPTSFIFPFSSNDTLEIIDNFEAFYAEIKPFLESNQKPKTNKPPINNKPHPNAIALDSIIPPLTPPINLLAPIKSPRQDVICLGINYLEHAKESARFKKEDFSGKREEAVYFSKRVNECNAPIATLNANNQTKQLDYEVELAVIISRDCRNVRQEDAKEYIFGYSVCNDVSARDLQAKHKQWYAGKSLEGGFVLGPCIVLRDSINPSMLAIKSYVNNELRQNSNTSLMVFNVDYVISQLSHYFTLKSGSIIAMGTPSGVGMGFNPPKFLNAGDVVKCEIEGIGMIETRII